MDRRREVTASIDGLLAIDLDGSGAIESGRELFGNYTVGPGNARFGTGFEALAIHDHPAMGGNGDGAINGHDAVYSALLVWRDANRDGVSQPHELVGLRALGIESLSLDAVPTGGTPAGDALITERAGKLAEVWVDLRY